MSTAQDYFTVVYERTFERVSRHVLFKSPTPQDAEDIVASVYSDFYQYVALAGRRPPAVTVYLLKMASHELSRFYSRRQDTDSLDDEILGLTDRLPDDESLELAFFDPFDTEWLWQAVARLKPQEQLILIARCRFDLTFAQIARRLRQPESTVKLRYYRSLRKLRGMLEKNATIPD